VHKIPVPIQAIVTRKKGKFFKVPKGIKFRGSGKYKEIGETLGGHVSRGLSSVGGILDTIMGSGDYTIAQNSLMTNTPGFPDHNGATDFTLREFIQDVQGSIGFSVNSFVISPTNPVLFPWFSRISQAWEEYELKGLVFSYKPTSGSATGANTALGTVIMMTQYNPYDAVPANKQQMENYSFCTSGVPSCPMIHGVECKRSLTQQAILSVLPPSGISDLRFTNFGIFNIATVGMQGANTVGELWVSAHFSMTKKVQRVLSRGDHYLISSAPSYTNGPMGSGAVPISDVGSNFLAYQIIPQISAGATRIYFGSANSGNYTGGVMVTWNYYATTVDSSHPPTFTVDGTGVTTNPVYNTHSGYAIGAATTTAAIWTLVGRFIVSGPGWININLPSTFAPTTATNSDLIIEETPVV